MSKMYYYSLGNGKIILNYNPLLKLDYLKKKYKFVQSIVKNDNYVRYCFKQSSGLLFCFDNKIIYIAIIDKKNIVKVIIKLFKLKIFINR